MNRQKPDEPPMNPGLAPLRQPCFDPGLSVPWESMIYAHKDRLTKTQPKAVILQHYLPQDIAEIGVAMNVELPPNKSYAAQHLPQDEAVQMLLTHAKIFG